MEQTLVIFKPCTIQRGILGEIIKRFEQKCLILCGLKMIQLTDELLTEHYAHLKEVPYFQQIKDSMMVCPVVVACWKGVDAVEVVRSMTGSTNGRVAQPGTIRGDFSMSIQKNIVHASDSTETAAIEIKRFFQPEELFSYPMALITNFYANNEC